MYGYDGRHTRTVDNSDIDADDYQMDDSNTVVDDNKKDDSDINVNNDNDYGIDYDDDDDNDDDDGSEECQVRYRCWWWRRWVSMTIDVR